MKRIYGRARMITRGARHQIQVIADDGSLLRTFDIRDITKESGLKFLGRKVDITG